MLSAEVGYIFLASILCLSGVQGHAKRICALEGSSVDLRCSANHPTSSIKWNNMQKKDKQHVPKELNADGNRLVYNMSKDGLPFLTINYLRKSDANLYCCFNKGDNIKHCLEREIQLSVTDLQVQVIPSTEGQTVTLKCSTSCALTETPEVYIWYKNRESLYQDWSPWYQELVSSEEAVTYSCAIKGYEDLRAPEVSVDSVTPTCFRVTYAKGRKCKNKMNSGDKSCTITYPREVHVERGSSTPVSLTCAASCSMTEPETTYRWYRNRQPENRATKQFSVHSTHVSFSCAIAGLEYLRSDEVCTEDNKCWTVNYDRRRICALGGSSVNISSNYSHPRDTRAIFKWYKLKRGGKEEAKVISPSRNVTFAGPHKILRIDNLKRDDSAKYTLRAIEEKHGEEIEVSKIPGVMLVVTGLRVTLSPSAVVTEDQRVKMTCSTSCPLPENSTFTWYLNSQPLNPQGKNNKHLILDKVSKEHAGNYSCSAQTGTYSFRSIEEALTVQSAKGKQTSAPPAAVAAAGVSVVLLVITILIVYFCIRKKKNSHQSTKTEAPINPESLNPDPVHEDISAHPAEQEELHYSSVLHVSETQADPLYSNFQSHQPRDQDNVAYAVVNFRPQMAPE